MAMVKFFYFFILTLFISCCSKLLDDDQFELIRKDIELNTIRTDGIYYRPNLTNKECSIILLYKNGIYCLWSDAIEISALTNIESKFLDISIINKRKNIKYIWGIVDISQQKISLERWYPSEPPLKSFIKSGKIINDSTFELETSRRSHTSEIRNISEKFYFRKSTTKPDSSNPFVP